MGETGRSLRELCEGLGMPEGQTAVVDWLAGYLGGVVELPKGWDGKPLRPGETVWMGGREMKVTGIKFFDDGPIVTVSGESCWMSIADKRDLTHERPDSWERLEEDCGMPDVDYCDSHGLLEREHHGHPAAVGSCAERMARDLVRRARALSGAQKVAEP